MSVFLRGGMSTKAYATAQAAAAQSAAEAYATAQAAAAQSAAIAAGFSVGQTWQDVTGSRSLSAVYTNSTGKPIMVGITFSGQGASPSFQVDGLQVIWASLPLGARTPCTVVVPNGSTYQLTSSGAALTIDRWEELR